MCDYLIRPPSGGHTFISPGRGRSQRFLFLKKRGNLFCLLALILSGKMGWRCTSTRTCQICMSSSHLASLDVSWVQGLRLCVNYVVRKCLSTGSVMTQVHVQLRPFFLGLNV